MNTDQLSSLVRTVMKLAAALLASHGLADTAGLINTPDVTAAVLLIVSLLWSHFSHADPDGTPPTTGTGTRLALWLALIIPALVFTGCAALAAYANVASATLGNPMNFGDMVTKPLGSILICMSEHTWPGQPSWSAPSSVVNE